MNLFQGKRLWRFDLLLMALVFLVTTNLALAQVSASVSGRIEDPSGAAMSGATVTVTSLETGATRTATADETGTYRVLSLPVGQYEVKAEKAGFKTVVQKGITLVVAQQAVVNLKLEVGAVQQEVTVTADVPVVNTTTASVSGLVGERQVKDLPLNGRSFDNLIALNAGAVNMSAGAPTNTANGPRSSFTVAGRRPDQTMYLLNGVEVTGGSAVTSEPVSASGEMLGIDAVREFNVLTDTYSAQYGKRPGAQVSIVTMSGTNQIHGTAFEFLRNSDLDARNFFDHPLGERIPPFRRNQFGGALGGPIRKDKTFIFGNYEGFRQRLAESSVSIVPDANARLGLLPNAQGVPTPIANLSPGMLPYTALWPLPNGPNLGSGFAQSFNNPRQMIQEDYGTARFDHNFSDKDTVSLNYTIDDGFAVNPNPDPLFALEWTIQSHVASLQEQHIFSQQTINTARVGFTRAYALLNSPPLIPLPASLSFFSGKTPGALNIGGGSSVATSGGGGSITAAGGTNLDDWITRNLFTYTDDVQRILGKHQISFGVWFQNLEDDRHAVPVTGGNASFSSLTTFLQGTVSTFQGRPNTSELGFRMLMGAWYVQDTIALRPNLTLSLGLRHEFTNGWNAVNGRQSNYIPGPNGVLETNPVIGNVLTENNAKWLFNPRVGLSWDPFGNGKTSIRVGGGIYHHLQDELSSKMENNYPFNGNVVFGSNTAFLPLVPVQPGVPPPPTCGPGVPSPCATYSPSGVQPNFKTPTVAEWNFSVEQQITPNTAVRAAYVGSHGSHLMVALDLNTIDPQICSNPSGCTSGGINKATGFVPQGTLYVPVGTRPNPYLGNAGIYNSEGNSSYNALQLELKHQFSRGLGFRANYTWSKNMDTVSEVSSALGNNEAPNAYNPYNMRMDWGPAAFDMTHQATVSGSYELPLGHGKPWLSGLSGAGDKLVSGWQANWILTVLSGFPFTPEDGANQSGNGDTTNPDRPNLNPAFSGPVIVGTPNQWFNPNAFLLSASGNFGNVGKGVLRGPGLGDLDLSLFKTTSLGERIKLEFRAEVFNILNHANFSFPNITVFSGSAISPSAGVITATATTSRQVQFGLKLVF